jgi:type VI secretion system protein ImpA
MTSAITLDYPALLAPIPGANPAGSNTPFEIKDQLEQLRKEIDPSSFSADDPLRPSEFRKADWNGIIKLATQTLTQTSKDLQVAARMVEALTKVNGFQGLADGLQLLEGLVDQAWDRLVPPVDDPSDLDIRSAPFEWLDDPDHGASFPSTVGTIKLVDATKDSPEMGLLQWKQGSTGPTQGGASPVSLDQILAGTGLEVIRERYNQVSRCRQILEKLVGKLSEKLKELAPSMGQLRGILDQCDGILRQMIAKKTPVAGGSPTSAAGEKGDGKSELPHVGSREQAYQMMAQAADILASIEPHSPVPYLVRRAVQLGGLPFPDLIQAFVREQAVLDTMFRELGIPKKEQQ